MNLEHSFTVPVGIDEAWKILLDIELIGPCMPGAAIDSVDGDDFTGTVKVKLGPIGLTYKGKASFIEKDEAAHRAVIDARGRDARGNGTASAKVTATLTEAGGSTTVNVDTNLDITGKPAQFGRGVMVDVGNKLIGQFADNLAKTISADPGAASADTASPSDTASPAEAAVAAVESSEAGASAATKPARKRTPRPKPGDEGGSAVASDLESEVTAEDTALDQGTTGGPIEQAALAAVSEAPASFGSPGASSTPSANGTSAKPAAPRTIVPPRDVEPINLIESAGPRGRQAARAGRRASALLARAHRVAPPPLEFSRALLRWRTPRGRAPSS